MDKRRYRFLSEGEATKRKDELDILMVVVFSRGLLIRGYRGYRSYRNYRGYRSYRGYRNYRGYRGYRGL